MPRATQTDLAVLAALSVEPMTGYALREAILAHLGAFWSESFGQIYPALARLRDAGLVEAGDGDRPGSSAYRLTASGRARLVELMREPPTRTPPRNGMLLRLFFGDALGARACRELVVEYRGIAAEQLAALAAARRETEAASDPAHRPYQLMTIAAGEHTARASLAWADETIATLDALIADGR
ncbi:PadR family transcriptional regulator [Protaetiibacter intestinalis]|uniref:PadR family transcriptional regulator n=1 Tax=Protaetiibacter intestinalis TaxID=2419774 RepID=A0A387B7G0_9MICO|nr:PadR family transcriptional regulator [Protaetiibacter intestinalis]AYF97721.1 PadR family transcriptional regulator [Protaetiibacter intestinalis]